LKQIGKKIKKKTDTYAESLATREIGGGGREKPIRQALLATRGLKTNPPRVDRNICNR